MPDEFTRSLREICTAASPEPFAARATAFPGLAKSAGFFQQPTERPPTTALGPGGLVVLASGTGGSIGIGWKTRLTSSVERPMNAPMTV